MLFKCNTYSCWLNPKTILTSIWKAIKFDPYKK